MPTRVLIVAGDPSGDHQGARLARELLARRPDLELYGLGGSELAAAGLDVVDDLPSLSAIGLFDAVRAYPRARGMLAHLQCELQRRPPQAAVLIDCGGFNLRLARSLRQLGVPILGYFPPGSWSGSAKRAQAVAAAYDAVATPFPNALPAYRELGFPAAMVGHPLVDEYAGLVAQREPQPADPPTLAILPGSRRQEIRHIMPHLLAAARRLRAARPELRLVISRAPSVRGPLFDRLIAASGLPLTVVDGSLEALQKATACLIKSGTITLEATLLRVPMVVVYRASLAAYAIAAVYYWPRPRYWAMPNILAQDEIVPQLFQWHAHPDRVAAEAAPLLSDTPQRQAMVARLDAVARSLDGGDATARTAAMVLRMLDGQPAVSPDSPAPA